MCHYIAISTHPVVVSTKGNGLAAHITQLAAWAIVPRFGMSPLRRDHWQVNDRSLRTNPHKWWLAHRLRIQHLQVVAVSLLLWRLAPYPKQSRRSSEERRVG